MAAGLGNIAAAIAGDHRRNLDPILLEFDGIGDDMFGDIVDGHWFLRGECRIDDKFAAAEACLCAVPTNKTMRRCWWARLDAFASDSFAHSTRSPPLSSLSQ